MAIGVVVAVTGAAAELEPGSELSPELGMRVVSARVS
jgi:hypothetical protein